MTPFDPEQAHLQERRFRDAQLVDARLVLLEGDPDDIEGKVFEIVGCGFADDLPHLLWRLWTVGQLSNERLRTALPPVWRRNLSPSSGTMRRGIGTRAWVSMFRAAGFLYNVPPLPSADPWLTSALRGDEVLEIWRGSAVRRRDRMSWTTSSDCAAWFADGAATFASAAIFRGQFGGADVLAAFGKWGEQEIVVDPTGLRGVEVIQRVPHRPFVPRTLIRPSEPPESEAAATDSATG
jgi:hypothetical protein